MVRTLHRFNTYNMALKRFVRKNWHIIGPRQVGLACSAIVIVYSLLFTVIIMCLMCAAETANHKACKAVCS